MPFSDRHLNTVVSVRIGRETLKVVLAAMAAALLAAPAHAAVIITSQTPSKGTVGSLLHVEGTGCKAPPGSSAGTFQVENGSGVEFVFDSDANGNFSFDYPVPPAEAGQQTADSTYPTEIFCRSLNRTSESATFEITGPTFVLNPARAKVGELVRVEGQGCVQDGDGADDGLFFLNGKQIRSFKADTRFAFSFAFRVPELKASRRYIAQVNCLIQRIESASGEGAQRAVVPTLLTVAPGGVATQPTGDAAAESSVPILPIVGGLAGLVLIGVGVGIVRRRRPDEPSTKDDFEPLAEPWPVFTAAPDPEPEPEPEVLVAEPEPEPEPEPAEEVEVEEEVEEEEEERPRRLLPLRAERIEEIDYAELARAADARRELDDAERYRPRDLRPRRAPLRATIEHVAEPEPEPTPEPEVVAVLPEVATEPPRYEEFEAYDDEYFGEWHDEWDDLALEDEEFEPLILQRPLRAPGR